MAKLAAVMLALVLMTAGCGGGRRRALTNARLLHASSAHCPLDRVDSEQIASRRYVAWGCGYRGIYNCSSHDCALDGSLTRD